MRCDEKSRNNSELEAMKIHAHRQCLSCGIDMNRIPGYWAFNGLDRRPGGGLIGGVPSFSLNGQGCIVKLWSCPRCNEVRIYADDSAD